MKPIHQPSQTINSCRMDCADHTPTLSNALGASVIRLIRLERQDKVYLQLFYYHISSLLYKNDLAPMHYETGKAWTKRELIVSLFGL